MVFDKVFHDTPICKLLKPDIHETLTRWSHDRWVQHSSEKKNRHRVDIKPVTLNGCVKLFGGST